MLEKFTKSVNLIILHYETRGINVPIKKEDIEMKQWQEAKLQQLDIEETAHDWLGIYRDGGYIGDGEVSGHLSWDKNNNDNSGDTNRLS